MISKESECVASVARLGWHLMVALPLNISGMTNFGLSVYIIDAGIEIVIEAWILIDIHHEVLGIHSS